MNKIDNNVNLVALLHPRKHSSNNPMKFMTQNDIFSPKSDVALHSNAAVGTKVLYQSISKQFSSSLAVAFKDKSEPQEAVEESSFFDYEKVANNVLSFIGNRIEAAKADGVDQEGLEELLQQARTGIEQGFGEALKELEDLSLLDEGLAEDIQTSRTLIDDGINELQQNLQPPIASGGQPATEIFDSLGQEFAIDRQVALENAAYVSKSRDSDLSITTADGDVVTISFSDFHERAAVERYSASTGEGFSSESYQASSSSYSSMNFSYSVEGELDDGEKEAIGTLIKDINKLQKEFFSGDINKAFEMALDIGYDKEELSGFRLDLQQTQTTYVSQKYAEVNNFGEGNALAQNKEVKPLLDYIGEIQSLAETARSLLAPEENQYIDLLDSVFEAEFGRNAQLLNQFKNFMHSINGYELAGKDDDEAATDKDEKSS
jgi:hypothetical protein